MRFKEKVKGDDNRRRAYIYLTETKGLEPHIAAGIIGNFMQESGHSLNIEAYNPDDLGKPTFGLAQWRGDRLAKLKKVAGKRASTLEGQLDFMMWELNNTEKRAFKKLQQTENAQEAALAFSQYYERPHKDYAHNEKRQKYAKNIYTTFVGEPQEYDYYNDPQKLYTEENTHWESHTPMRDPVTELEREEYVDYSVPTVATPIQIPYLDLNTVEGGNGTQTAQTEETQTPIIDDAISKIEGRKNELATLQQMIKASEAKFINVEGEVIPEANSYGYPSMQKGGNSKKKVEEDYGIVDFAKDAYEAWFNPKNYGVDDYSKEEDFDAAYKAARNNGEKEFMYQNRRYNSNYKGTPEQQLNETGITDDQIQGNNFIRERLSKNLAPKGYENKVSRVWQALISDEIPQERQEFEEQASDTTASSWETQWNQKRLDAHNLYTGKPQKYGTFSVSEYKPTKSKDKDALYYSVTSPQLKIHLRKLLNEDGSLKENLAMDDSGVMGNYTVEQGEDEKGRYISYYDKWDIEPLDYGKPMEIYDRIYLQENPDAISEAEFSEQMDKLSKEEIRIYNTHKDKDGNLPKKYSEQIEQLWEKAVSLRRRIGGKYTIE